MVAQGAKAKPSGRPAPLPEPPDRPHLAAAGAAPAAVPLLDGVRVAVLNFREPSQTVAGGAEEYAWRVSAYLVGQGASVSFLTSRERYQTRAESRDGIRLRRMGGKYLVYLLVPLWLLLRRRRFDVVVDCMNGIPFFSPLVARRRTRVICVVHHVHDRQFYAFFPRWLARIGCFIEGPVARLLYRRCTTVTVSESSRHELRERLRWLAPIEVVPNGSPTVRPVASEPVPGAPAVVYLGRLVGHKRVERVVELAAELAPTRPGLHVHVVGRGPEHDRLAERVGGPDVAGRVHLHGFLPEAEKNAVLSRARLNVTASEFEGWGLTVIEAAALGVPTVAYDVAGLRDSVRHGVTGWLVRDGERLADVVDHALRELDDPLTRARMARACRRWAGEFTWGKTGAAMTRLVAGELGRLPARPAAPPPGSRHEQEA
ncbi:glycosyltransferase family 4 protein [Microbispora sp. H10836]|uniref:glycosyltransferase family 4 protein n=1 Tax=Microbispora sp. H10836 TaxID=2729106 RepID=UPI001475872D|nr:glycosyltransferase family 4 protein [Microbispora sp. H10836]